VPSARGYDADEEIEGNSNTINVVSIISSKRGADAIRRLGIAGAPPSISKSRAEDSPR
jgi:hypothetical protein